MTWSIIIAAANREKRLVRAMEEANFRVFLPLKRTWRGRFAKHAETKRCVMPGYVFAIMDRHEIHAFHGDGACRLLVPSPLAQADLDRCINGWIADMEAGVFDDEQPKVRGMPLRHRNRRTRRAVRKAVDWQTGLQSVLESITEERPMAA